MSKRTQAGHVDLTDVHRLMAILAVLVLVALAAISYSVYRLFAWARRCDHQPGDWQMRDMGLGKARYCTKCGKCTDLL